MFDLSLINVETFGPSEAITSVIPSSRRLCSVEEFACNKTDSAKEGFLLVRIIKDETFKYPNGNTITFCEVKEVLDPENPELMGDSLIKLTLFHGYSAQYIQHKVRPYTIMLIVHPVIVAFKPKPFETVPANRASSAIRLIAKRDAQLPQVTFILTRKKLANPRIEAPKSPPKATSTRSNPVSQPQHQPSQSSEADLPRDRLPGPVRSHTPLSGSSVQPRQSPNARPSATYAPAGGSSTTSPERHNPAIGVEPDSGDPVTSAIDQPFLTNEELLEVLNASYEDVVENPDISGQTTETDTVTMIVDSDRQSSNSHRYPTPRLIAAEGGGGQGCRTLGCPSAPQNSDPMPNATNSSATVPSKPSVDIAAPTEPPPTQSRSIIAPSPLTRPSGLDPVGRGAYARVGAPEKTRTYVQLDSVRVHKKKYNTWAVISEILGIPRRFKSKLVTKLIIKDESLFSIGHLSSGMRFDVLADNMAEIPSLEAGDVLRIHGLVCEIFNGIPDSRVYSGRQLTVFKGGCADDIEGKSTREGGAEVTESDRLMVKQLRTWYNRTKEFDPDSSLALQEDINGFVEGENSGVDMDNPDMEVSRPDPILRDLVNSLEAVRTELVDQLKSPCTAAASDKGANNDGDKTPPTTPSTGRPKAARRTRASSSTPPNERRLVGTVSTAVGKDFPFTTERACQTLERGESASREEHTPPESPNLLRDDGETMERIPDDTQRSSPNKLTNKRMAEDCENSSPPRKRNKSDSDAYSIIRVAQSSPRPTQFVPTVPTRLTRSSQQSNSPRLNFSRNREFCSYSTPLSQRSSRNGSLSQSNSSRSEPTSQSKSPRLERSSLSNPACLERPSQTKSPCVERSSRSNSPRLRHSSRSDSPRLTRSSTRSSPRAKSTSTQSNERIQKLGCVNDEVELSCLDMERSSNSGDQANENSSIWISEDEDDPEQENSSGKITEQAPDISTVTPSTTQKSGGILQSLKWLFNPISSFSTGTYNSPDPTDPEIVFKTSPLLMSNHPQVNPNSQNCVTADNLSITNDSDKDDQSLPDSPTKTQPLNDSPQQAKSLTSSIDNQSIDSNASDDDGEIDEETEGTDAYSSGKSNLESFFQAFDDLNDVRRLLRFVCEVDEANPTEEILDSTSVQSQAPGDYILLAKILAFSHPGSCVVSGVCNVCGKIFDYESIKTRKNIPCCTKRRQKTVEKMFLFYLKVKDSKGCLELEVRGENAEKLVNCSVSDWEQEENETRIRMFEQLAGKMAEFRVRVEDNVKQQEQEEEGRGRKKLSVIDTVPNQRQAINFIDM